MTWRIPRRCSGAGALAIALAAGGCGTSESVQQLAVIAYQSPAAPSTEPQALVAMASSDAPAPAAITPPEARPEAVGPRAPADVPAASAPAAGAPDRTAVREPAPTAGFCAPGQIALAAPPPRADEVSGRPGATFEPGVWTSADLPGVWTASDGSAGCACRIVLEGGRDRRAVTAEGCVTPQLRRAAAWRIDSIGFGNPDLLLLDGGGRVLARLDARGSRYFDGSLAGAPFTLWR
ncbi:AprI/Inh family metalloprotease inhibitor [Propylenella binzhouense]|uniref:Alkaline proteinase inhibitor/ Outer membrane lipoprotein Omp19 domain-containing protein n=1 Tax=Propylenella binzhouense TaxID=2555902 RepID=A0A964WS18_9HYPH|nr:AprI/Inh family metalloprotease inhibitor [Propylenella binzhouense]MYZ46503.1 hypothetical protein [Propylenella binzhouense]